MKPITEGEWLAELERLGKESKAKNGVGLTPREWAAAMGWPVRKVLSVIRLAMERGSLIRGKRYIECVNERMSPITTYSFLTTKKPATSGRAARRIKRTRAGSGGAW